MPKRKHNKDEQESTAKEIKQYADAVRQKYQALRLGRHHEDEAMTRMLKPVSAPLQQIVKHTKPVQEIKQEPVKQEPVIFRRPHTSQQKTPLHYKFPRHRDLYTPPPRPFFTSTPLSRISQSSVQEEDDDGREEASYMSPDPDTDDYPVMNQTFLQRRLNPNDKSIDRLFSPRPSDDGSTWYMGNQVISFLPNGDIQLGTQVYKGTQALYHFLFMKTMPRDYTDEDVKAYARILRISSAHRKGYKRNQALAHTNVYKYRKVISQVIRQVAELSWSSRVGESTTTGEGYKLVTDQAKDYVYYSNPNELVDRLRLLVAAEQAGNNLDHHRNEMETILQELREIGIITD